MRSFCCKAVFFFSLVLLLTEGLRKSGLASNPKPVLGRISKNCLPFITIGVLASAIALIGPSSSANANEFPACVTESNPQTTVISCRQLGLKSDGRLLGCQANENCFSTSATAATKYSSPWKYSAQNTEEAWTLLRAAVENQGLKVLKADPISHYMLAAEKGTARQGQPQPAGSSLFYEFLLKPEEKLVLYRAVVDKTVFVYPLQQPVADFGVLKSRLSGIISKTGWKSVAAASEGDDTMEQRVDSAKQSLWNVFI
jgi:hypothetical protein